MARRGRRRKSGRRERNGRPQRQPVEAFAELAASQPHRRDVLASLHRKRRIAGDTPEEAIKAVKKELRNQKLGSELGRYCLDGVITEGQYEGCAAFGKVVHAYRSAIEAPKSEASSWLGKLGQVGGGVVVLSDARSKRDMENYTKMIENMHKSGMDPETFSALVAVVLEDQSIYESVSSIDFIAGAKWAEGYFWAGKKARKRA
jgi:hypothetical protein